MNKDLTRNASDNKDRESTERTSRENGPVTVELLEALRDGDHEAYKTVYLHYRGPIENFLYKLLRSREEAEEIAQHVFMTLWEAGRVGPFQKYPYPTLYDRTECGGQFVQTPAGFREIPENAGLRRTGSSDRRRPVDRAGKRTTHRAGRQEHASDAPENIRNEPTAEPLARRDRAAPRHV